MHRALRRIPLVVALAPVLLTVMESACLAAASVRPHVIVVVADDLGYSDLGSYGGEIPTPSLDAVARAGTRFTDFYVTPRCSPTRAALLTGHQPHEVGVGHLNRSFGARAYRGELDGAVPTVAEVLGAAGYRCYLAGKWHLAHNPAAGGDGDQENWPTRRGFDRFFGTLRGSGSYWSPPSLMEDGVAVAPRGDFYYTDAIAAAAAGFVDDHFRHTPDAPLFLYLSFTAPHWPLHARAADLAGPDDPWTRGWDVLRAARFARQQATGLAATSWALAPRPSRINPWQEVERPDWEARRMRVYAAMVESLDRGVGRVMDSLRRHGALDDTLLFVLSDNGASAEEFRGLGRLARYFMPLPTDPTFRFGDEPGLMPGSRDTFETYGAGWAWLSNAPFRGFKHETYEGGIASPLVVRWPGHVPAGAVDRTPTHVVDILPTLLGVTGARYPPPRWPAAPVSELAGRSLLPVRAGPDPAAETRPLFWEHEGNRAVRRGRYKLVSSWPRGWELYDLERDRGEVNDLAASQPRLVAELEALHERWSRRVGVRPWPWVIPAVRRIAFGASILAILTLVFIARRLKGRRHRPTD